MDKIGMIFGPLYFIIMIGIFFLTATAYFEGAEVWFGWGWFLSLVVFVVACMFQGLGGLFLSVVAFYGMWKGWEWEWWQAFLVAFPAAAFMILSLLGGGVAAFVSSLTSRRRRVHEEIELK